MDKFVVTPKEYKSITMTISINKTLQEKYNRLVSENNHSRNELINMAFYYVLDNMEIKDNK